MGASLPSQIASDVASFLRPIERRDSPAAWLFRVVAFCGLTALAAQVRIPVWGSPVPMTLQSLVVMFAGLTLTPAQAASAMLLYLGAGTCGVPVFAAHSTGIVGPTGGYLIGFLFAAFVIAVLRGRSRGNMRRGLAAVCGLGVLFACGVSWLALWTGGNVRTAIGLGLAPFVIKGLVEIGIALAVTSVLRRRNRKQESGIGEA